MPAPDTPRRFPLPPRVLKLLGIAFGAGLLLFLLVWWDQRNDTDFFTAGQSVNGGTDPAALPVPLPPDLASGDDAASGLRIPQVQGGSAAAAPPRPVRIEAPPPPPPPADAPTRPAAVDRTDPSPLSTPAPRYPAEPLRRGIGGSVQVRVTVAADGSVERLELAQSSGNRELDRAALEAVRRWRFQPATLDGQPVVADVIVPLDFSPGR